MPSFDNAERRSYEGDVLSLLLPYVRRLLSRSPMCLGRHCCGHPVHVSQVGGCPHMCPWVAPHAPPFGRQLWGLPSRVEYLSPQGVLLPLVYGTTASPLWLQLRGLSAWQATPSWTVYRLACQRLLPWPWVTFAIVPDAAWPGSDQWPWGTAPAAGRVSRLGRPSASNPWGVGSFLSLGRPMCARVCGVLGHLAPVHRCACSVRCFACRVSWATWLLFTSLPPRCVALRVRCPGPLGPCFPVCPRGFLYGVCGVLGHLAPVHQCASVLLCVCGVLGHLAPVHRCARVVCCVACAVSWATWLLFTSVRVRCFACAVSWPTWLLFTGVPPGCVVLRVRCPGPLGSCSPVCLLGALLCVCGVLGHLAPVHRCARSVRCFVGAVSWATWLRFTNVPARCVALRVRCPGPLGSWSPVSPRGLLCWLCGVLGHLAPVHRCARSVRCFACGVSCATWLLFTGASARCVVLAVGYPGQLRSGSPVRPLGALLCWCGVLGHLAPVHRCACSVSCFACAVSWAAWLLFTSVPAWFVVLHVQCSGPFGSFSPVCPLGALFCLCGVLRHLAPVHRCARLVCCVACAVSWATSLLFTGAPARCVALLVRCPGPLGSTSPVCLLGALLCVCGVLGHFAPDHLCTRSVCCVGCAVSWATSLLFTGAPARCVALPLRCPGPLGSCSPLCLLCALCCACGVLGSWLLFTGVPARCIALRVRCPGPLASCSPVCSPGVLCSVLGLLAPVHRCARLVCCAVGCVCGASLRGAHSSIWAAAICSRQGLGTLRARTRLSGQRLVVGRHVVKLNLGEQKVDIPLVVTKDAVCAQALKDRLLAALRQAVASRAAGYRLVHLDVETLCQLLPRLGIKQLVSIRNNFSRASFESNHFTHEHVDKVAGCHVFGARDGHSTWGESVNRSHDGVMASSGRRQSWNPIDGHTMPLGVGYWQGPGLSGGVDTP